MTMIVLFILLLIAIYTAIMRHNKTCLLTLIIMMGYMLAIGTGILPAALLTNLQNAYINLKKPSWGKNNAIILLGAGAIKLPEAHTIAPSIMAYSRINETAQLYLFCVNSHQHCTVIISGGDAAKTGASEAAAYQNTLLSLGIPSRDIILESHSMNTFQNAEYTSKIINERKFDQIYLVTAGVHLKRSLLYFAHFNIHAIPARADYLTVHRTLMPLSYNFTMMDFAMHEYLGIARYYIYNALGWNIKAQSPGAI